MSIKVATTTFQPGERQHTCGGELGVTLFVSGLRIFVPERACLEDIEHAMEGLRRLAECGGYVRKAGQTPHPASGLPDIQDCHSEHKAG